MGLSVMKKQQLAETRERREWSLGNPVFLWLINCIVTFLLSILLAVLVSLLSTKVGSRVFPPINWEQMLIINLYPTTLVLAVTTFLQNLGALSPSQEAQAEQQPRLSPGWTAFLILALVVYAAGYSVFFLYDFPWRTRAAYISSALLAGISFCSFRSLVLQQEANRKAREEKKRLDKIAKKARKNKRDFSAGTPNDRAEEPDSVKTPAV